MIAITPAPTLPSPNLAEVENLVQCLEAMEAQAARLMLDAYATQIAELARSAMYQLDYARGCVRDIPATSNDGDNWGEGMWEVILAEGAAQHIGRYSQEARHWLRSYRLAEQRMAAGEHAFLWTPRDADLAVGRTQIEHERSEMEKAQ